MMRVGRAKHAMSWTFFYSFAACLSLSLPLLMNEVRARAPAWCAFLLDEQGWTLTQMHWFMVFVGDMVQDGPKHQALDYMSFALFGRGPASNDIAARVGRLLFTDSRVGESLLSSSSSSKPILWVTTSKQHSYAVADAIWPHGRTESMPVSSALLPSRMVFQGYHRGWPSYSELFYSTFHQILPLRGQHDWSGRWNCKIASVLSDTSSDTAIPDLDYLMGKTAIFLLGASSLVERRILHNEVSAFLALCTETSRTVLESFKYRTMPCPWVCPADLPWSVGPLQFIVERILSSTPLIPDLVITILLPYLETFPNGYWHTPKQDADTLNNENLLRLFQTL
jgi:hypothetical protein